MEKEAVRSTVNSYKDLHVWKAAIELAVDCYSATKTFPTSETYGMTSQLRRSSPSIAANIAEGYGREHRGSYLQFLRIAQGSLKEVETHLILCGRVGLMVDTVVTRLLVQADDLGRMLRALIRSLQQRA
ncbi:four helix bundle protein [Paramesorhizobium deserti]|uniref:Four helix bundle protein n=1 Tax=Paramesorhizobium deserti TaxID=1494590 RepID=A0A135HVB6_9HYPH|nr:four helix bundle protein [Paramesorhizobium deserti]KXF77114.1 four helix bundle protein [Paramesorhizobium deserti]